MSTARHLNTKIQISSSPKTGVKLKICGMADQNNILEIAGLQPDYLGFIFYKNSSRFFEGAIPELPSDIKKVGVFVDATVEDIIHKVETHRLDFIQLHGEESPEFCQELKRYFAHNLPKSTDSPPVIQSRVGIIKVFPVKDNFDFGRLQPYEAQCDFFLFDTKGKLPGGNGYTFNWEVLKTYPSKTPYFLSGGIGLEEIGNLQEFLQNQHEDHNKRYCHAIDVNSKFELKPGLKNTAKLAQFKQEINKNNQI